MSMVKSVELLLKMEVREDIRAAIMTAIMSPRKPVRHGRKHPLTTVFTFKVSLLKIFESRVLTAWHELDDQFGEGDVGASHLGATNAHTLLWIHTPHRV